MVPVVSLGTKFSAKVLAVDVGNEKFLPWNLKIYIRARFTKWCQPALCCLLKLVLVGVRRGAPTLQS